jgi:hypothetical protein
MIVFGVAIVSLFAFAGFLGYCCGRSGAIADAQFERALEQRRRDQLARDIEEGLAALHARPQLHSVADVVPLRRRTYRDGAA